LPVFKNYIVFKPFKSVTVFLTLNLGVIRSDTTDPERTLTQAEQEEGRRGQTRKPQVPGTNEAARTGKIVAEQQEQLKEQGENLKSARGRIADQRQQIDRWRGAAQEKDLRIALLEEKLLTDRSGDPEDGAVDPGDIVWVFGVDRAGGTWLGSMIGELEGLGMWGEPGIGELFGRFYHEKVVHQQDGKGSIMDPELKGTWLRSIRTFVLDAVEANYPLLAEGGNLAITESSGSLGAPLLAEALPESRMVFLIRNPRDTVSSALGTVEEGGIAHESQGSVVGSVGVPDGLEEQPGGSPERHPDRLVESFARTYLQYAGNAKRAYEEHTGPKSLVRYEELLADTPATMRHLYAELGMTLDERKLAGIAAPHPMEQPPEEGSSGSVREAGVGIGKRNLTEEQERIVERITAPLVEEFYPG
jgi:hypothetical protein